MKKSDTEKKRSQEGNELELQIQDKVAAVTARHQAALTNGHQPGLPATGLRPLAVLQSGSLPARCWRGQAPSEASFSLRAVFVILCLGTASLQSMPAPSQGPPGESHFLLRR